MPTEAGARRAVSDGDALHPRVDQASGIWQIRSHTAARQVLQAKGHTSQAGFTSEFIPKGWLKHHPILISDGPLHDEQRRKVGRFLAPSVVADRYTTLMVESAETLVAAARETGGCLVDELALLYSVEVTRHVVGLTESSTKGLAKRLVRFFNQPPFDITKPGLGRTRRQWAMAALNGLGPILRFYLADVAPAIRARRRQPGEDIVSHLIAEDYTNADILVECLTYGTAGMVTTREFIAMALWHLLSDRELLLRYRRSAREERFAILEEIIRLEPVVGHLYRRIQQPLVIRDGDHEWELAAGDLVDLCLRQANTDPETFGENPLSLCPGRPLPRGVHTAGLSFSDGAHRCPGQALAILETDVLLLRLLELEPVAVTEPTLGWDDLVAGYRLRDFRLAFPSDSTPPGRR